jgi:hypothetical protein
MASSDTRANSFKTALCVTVVLRVFYSVVGALFSTKLKLDPAAVYSNGFTDNLIPQSDALRYAILGVWERFDTLWNIHIAQAGYDRPASVVFPPLYPCLIRLGTLITESPLAIALVISTVSSLLLFWAFHRLASFDLDPDATTRAAILYAVWPASFIFFAGYPDSLTIALMLWALVFGRSERWWLAGVAGFFAGFAKAVGFLVVIPLALLAWRKRSWRAAPVLLSGAGYFIYAAWLYASGRMLPAESYSVFWRSEVAPPWETIVFAFQNALAGYTMPKIHLALLVIAALAALSKRVRPEYVVYAVAALLFVLTKKSDPSQQQLARYVLILFPAPLNLALSLKEKGTFVIAAFGLMTVNLFFLQGFFNWWLVV